jgi:hypothetical protein
MAENRWYTEPETFVAVAALIVSISAVVVGIYEAALQREHDRAEVWPHLELSTYVTPKGASLYLENTGIGPAIVNSIVVMVDGRQRRDWTDALTALTGKAPVALDNSTVADHALRAGDRSSLVGVSKDDLPPGFWQYVGRISIRVCYASVFGEHWLLVDQHLGGATTWQAVKSCPPQPAGVEF